MTHRSRRARRRALALPLLTSLSLFLTPATSLADTMTHNTQTLSADHAAAQALVETMTTAFQNGNIDAVMQSYTPEAVVLFEPGTPVSGAGALRGAFGEMAALKPVFAYSGHEVVVAGDTAVHFAPWTMHATLPDGSEITQSGLSVAVMRKQADGSWRMVIDNPHGAHLMGQ